MTTYLWIGKPFAYPSPEVNTPANRVDKYCFNAAGNWKAKINQNGIWQWGATTGTPGIGDSVVIGCEFGICGADQELPGWTAARCPLLFGGYSGGVGQGTWSMTDGSTVQGTTWSNSLVDFKIDISRGWSFDVPVGGGLQEDYLSWAMGVDSAYSPGTDSSYYSTNTAGFRNPSNNLKLKVRDLISFVDETPSWRTPPLSFASSTGGYPSDGVYLYRGLKFDAVKAYTQTGISGTNGAVNTNIVFSGGKGQDLSVNNGSFNRIDINTEVISYTNELPYKMLAGSELETVKRGQLQLNGVVIKEIEYAKCDYINVNGGTAARVIVHQFPYGNSRLQSFEIGFTGSNLPLKRYFAQVSTDISCGFSGAFVYNDLYGITNSSNIPSTHIGNLVLSDRACVMVNRSETAENFLHYNGTYQDYYMGYYLWNSYRYKYYGVYGMHRPQAVNLSTTSLVPDIKINCASMANPDTRYGKIKFMPWGLYFTSSQLISTITNNGGYIYSTLDNISTSRVGQCYLGNFGSVDFNKAIYDSNAADIRFGGMSGSNLSGGIIMNDPTGTIYGSENMRLYTTQVKVNIIDERYNASTPSKIEKYNPTSSTK